MKTIEQFLQENQDTIFRYLVYNKFNIWTPNQTSNEYEDESVYLSDNYEFAKITDIINTPDGLLLELMTVDPDNPVINRYHTEYRLLKDIELSKFEDDQIEEPF